MLICASMQGENLLKNADFEEVNQGIPRHWKLFVMPNEGAVGLVDSETAYSQGRSIMLRNELPYEEEPANNWSQTVFGGHGGKELRLQGRIKTREATEAAIWIQCWRENPSAILHVRSTDDVTSVHGTMDWTPVDIRIKIPQDTDFIMCRCVLKGTGTAWFDDLRLEEKLAVEEPVATNKDKEETAGQRTAAAAEREALKNLIEANRALVETSRGLRESNEALLQQIRALQEDLRAMRERLLTIENELAQMPETPAEPFTPAPPLVPHGYPLEGTR